MSEEKELFFSWSNGVLKDQGKTLVTKTKVRIPGRLKAVVTSILVLLANLMIPFSLLITR
jgi:hypothetical protein